MVQLSRAERAVADRAWLALLPTERRAARCISCHTNPHGPRPPLCRVSPTERKSMTVSLKPVFDRIEEMRSYWEVRTHPNGHQEVLTTASDLGERAWNATAGLEQALAALEEDYARVQRRAALSAEALGDEALRLNRAAW